MRRLLIALVLLSALPAFPARAAGSPMACRLALQVVRQALEGHAQRENLVFSAEARSTFASLKTDELQAPPTGQRPIPSALAHAFIRERSRNAVAECANVRGALAAAGVRFDAEALAGARARQIPKRGQPMAQSTIIGVMLPVVSRDGRDALVETWQTCGGLCGIGTIIRYRRDGRGAWREMTAVGPSWMS